MEPSSLTPQQERKMIEENMRQQLNEISPENEQKREFFMCIISTQSNPDLEAEMKGLLLNSGVLPSDLTCQDITHEYEVLGLVTNCIKEKSGNITYPILFCNRDFIGGINEVKLFLKNDFGRKSDTEDFLSDFEKIEVAGEHISSKQGLLSGTLDVVEGLLSSLNPSSWFSASTIETKQADVPQYELLMTNWYFRQQLRIFRLYPKAFCRVHPRTQDVRASRPYTDIKHLEKVDSMNIILHYHNSSPDYLSGSPSDIQAICIFLKDQSILEKS